MKKLMIVPALAFAMLFTTNTSAQDTQISEKETAMITAETTAQEKVQKEYKKIEVAEVPEAVRTAVERDFSGATIAEAHVAEDRTYKIVIVADGQKRTLYADANGNWIKKSE